MLNENEKNFNIATYSGYAIPGNLSNEKHCKVQKK